MNATRYTITAENINKESYYNLVRLCEITGYADPSSAIVALNKEGIKTEWNVLKDECGNILKSSPAIAIPSL